MKLANCKFCNTQISIDIRASIYNSKCNDCKQKRRKKCMICKNEFIGWKKTKTCSKICNSNNLSKKRMDVIIKSGTSNFSTKQSIFEYKNIKLSCDSKLEKAAIIYLIDNFKMDKIERFNNILNFKVDDKVKRFNPDFYCKKDDKIYIVEVKMLWSSKSKHPYNIFINEKKKCLKDFCNIKKYNMIWLDFNYDKLLRKIYRKL